MTPIRSHPAHAVAAGARSDAGFRPFLEGPLPNPAGGPDVAPLDPAGEGEEVVQADLADADAVLEMTRGVNAVVYMAGAGREGTYEEILRRPHARALQRLRGRAPKRRAARGLGTELDSRGGLPPVLEDPRPHRAVRGRNSTIRHRQGLRRGGGAVRTSTSTASRRCRCGSARCVPEPTERRHLLDLAELRGPGSGSCSRA